MKHTIAFLTLLLCCSQPRQGGQGGAHSASSASAGGSGGADAGQDGGDGGKPPSDGGEGGWIEQADTGPDCGLPNGGIGPCIDPAKDCPPETACWGWKCEFGHCVHVPKF